MLTNACAAFGWPTERTLHDTPLAELLAMLACNAWGKGMEPAGETYEDRDISKILAMP